MANSTRGLFNWGCRQVTNKDLERCFDDIQIFPLKFQVKLSMKIVGLRIEHVTKIFPTKIHENSIEQRIPGKT